MGRGALAAPRVCPQGSSRGSTESLGDLGWVLACGMPSVFVLGRKRGAGEVVGGERDLGVEAGGEAGHELSGISGVMWVIFGSW